MTVLFRFKKMRASNISFQNDRIALTSTHPNCTNDKKQSLNSRLNEFTLPPDIRLNVFCFSVLDFFINGNSDKSLGLVNIFRCLMHIIIRFGYNALCHWLKECAL